MSENNRSRKLRRAARATMPVRRVGLHDQDDAGDVRDFTTPEQRWAMMWQLAINAYAFAGKPVPEPGLHRHIVRVVKLKG